MKVACYVSPTATIELVLDKVTFTDIFAQGIEKVMDTLKKLAAITIEQKEEQYA